MAALTGRTLLISIGGTEYNTQVFEAHVDADDADSKDITFAEAAAGGGRKYTLAITLTQDLIASTLWDKIFTAAGSDVTVLMKPYGNTAASATQPHFSMTANVREPNGTFIGGQADANVQTRYNIEVEWPLAAKPTRVVS